MSRALSFGFKVRGQLISFCEFGLNLTSSLKLDSYVKASVLTEKLQIDRNPLMSAHLKRNELNRANH